MARLKVRSRTHHKPTPSGGNGKPVCGFSFVSGINNEILKEYLGTGY